MDTADMDTPFLTRPDIRGHFGVAASTHWLAAQTAMRMLELGGSPKVKEIRGEGMLAAIEFDPEDVFETVTQVVAGMQKQGILIRAQEDHVGIYPPLTFSEGDVDTVIDGSIDVIGKMR